MLFLNQSPLRDKTQTCSPVLWGSVADLTLRDFRELFVMSQKGVIHYLLSTINQPPEYPVVPVFPKPD